MKKGKNLLRWEDYYQSYCYYLGEGYNSRVAFNKVWFDFVEQTGVTKVEVINYDSLESFKAGMYQRFKKKKEK